MIKKSAILLLFILANHTLAHAFQVNGYSLTKGDTFTSTSVIDQVITQSVMGQSMEIKQITTTSEKIEVVGVDGDSFILSLTNLSTKLEANTPQGSQTMDSEGNGPSDGLYKALKGKGYQFTLSKNGMVSNITGLDALRDSLTKELTGTPLAAALDQVLASFSDKSIQSSLENRFSIFAEDGSEQWTTSREMTINNMPVSVESEYLYASDDVIMVNSQLTIKDKIVAMGTEMDANLSGTQENMMTLDSTSGICTLSESTGTIEGTVNAQGLSIPISVLSVTTTNTVKD